MAGIEDYISQAEAAFEADAHKRRARQRVILIVVLVVLAAAGAGIAFALMSGGDDKKARQQEADKLVAEAGSPDFETKAKQLGLLATSEHRTQETRDAATAALVEELTRIASDVTLAEANQKEDLMGSSCRRLKILAQVFFADHPEPGGATLSEVRTSCRKADVEF